MNVVEALRQIKANRDLLARPVRWGGRGVGITLDAPHRPGFSIVPTCMGGITWHASYEDLTGDWEVIHYDEVWREGEL